MRKPFYKILTDQAILIEFEQIISPTNLAQVRAYDIVIQNANIYGVLELIPAYASLAIFYEPAIWTFEDLVEKIKAITKNIKKISLPESKVWEVPVSYAPPFAPDLKHVADENGLSIKEVIQIHTQTDYLVYMLGFLPGFVYLGGMDKRIACPRKSTPDLKVVAGSIAIGGEQTGIYSIESPAGWNVIGRTSLSFFDANKNPPFLIKQGDKVRFVAVDEMVL